MANGSHFEQELSVQMPEISSIPGRQQDLEKLIGLDYRILGVVLKETNLVRQASHQAEREDIMRPFSQAMMPDIPFLCTEQQPSSDTCRTSWHLLCNRLDRRGYRTLQTV